MRSGTTVASAVLFLGLAFGTSAWAQSPTGAGPHIAGSVGGSLFDDHLSPAQNITAGYRFNRIFGFEVGAELIQGLHFTEREDGSLALFVPASGNDGRALLFLTNAVATMPMRVLGFTPYVLAGGGMANIRQSVRFATGGIPELERSQNVLALTFGGGVEYPVWRGLALGVDVRYLHLFSERFDTSADRYALPDPVDPVRIGTRISYRF